jgi:probable HAF family extracellular repeat protein
MWCVLRNLLRASLIFTAFLLHANPTYSQVVISEPPGIETGVRGINDVGTAVGYSKITFSATTAFQYSGGTITSVNPPQANLFGPNLGPEATGINNSGQIVGFYSTASTFSTHGFLNRLAKTLSQHGHLVGYAFMGGYDAPGDFRPLMDKDITLHSFYQVRPEACGACGHSRTLFA